MVEIYIDPPNTLVLCAYSRGIAHHFGFGYTPPPVVLCLLVLVVVLLFFFLRRTHTHRIFWVSKETEGV